MGKHKNPQQFAHKYVSFKTVDLQIVTQSNFIPKPLVFQPPWFPQAINQFSPDAKLWRSNQLHKPLKLLKKEQWWNLLVLGWVTTWLHISERCNFSLSGIGATIFVPGCGNPEEMETCIYLCINEHEIIWRTKNTR